MEPDVVEIPPPIHHPSNLRGKNKVILHDVIDIDDDTDDVVIIGEKFNNGNKGKTIDAVRDDHQDVKFESVSGIASSKGLPSVSNNLVNVDGHSSDPSYNDAASVDIFSENYMDVDDYALLQIHFDDADIPAGVETPFTWFPPGYDIGSKKSGNSTLFPNAKKSPMIPSSQPSLSLKPTNPKIQDSSVGSSNIDIKMDNVDHSSGAELSSQLFSPFTPHSLKSAIPKFRGRTSSNASLEVDSSKPHWMSEPFHSKKKHASTYHGHIDNSGAHAGELLHWGKFGSTNLAAGSSISSHSNFIGNNLLSHPPVIGSGNPWLENFPKINVLPTLQNNIHYPLDPFHPLPEHTSLKNRVLYHAKYGFDGTSLDGPIVTISDEARDEILSKFQSFKQFDTVEDTSDHHFVRHSSSVKQPPKTWAKKIQDEWKILQKDLPDTIFVRVYESRMDLLRAVIIGAEGTPYHDGLYFFDVFFPSAYPNVPPQVHYHAQGLRLNPNLYGCGKVCLSLLNTWSGNKNEKWIPGVSTVLQVLVSIQGLILNAKPYFNEPGFASTSGSANGEKMSLQYNEDTFLLSLRTMMYKIQNPPKHFEDFVKGHFISRASDILVACKAYMEGAQVGCLVKGGVQDVDEGDQSCSQRFKDSLSGFIGKLVKDFSQIGAKDLQKFLPPATKPIVNEPS